MLPRKVFYSKPGSGCNLKTEVVNTEDRRRCRSEDSRVLYSDTIMDTSRSNSGRTVEDVDIPDPVKVSRKVFTRY